MGYVVMAQHIFVSREGCVIAAVAMQGCRGVRVLHMAQQCDG
jgi:hypothetical protein